MPHTTQTWINQDTETCVTMTSQDDHGQKPGEPLTVRLTAGGELLEVLACRPGLPDLFPLVAASADGPRHAGEYGVGP
jgi:hypothetical protein